MHSSTRIKLFQPIGIPAFVVASIFFVGCDSSTDLEGATTFEGRVTDEAGFGKAAGDVEGAIVTASNVSASGSAIQIQGEATTNAEGRFELATEGAANEVILTAEISDFRTKAMAYTDGRSQIQVMPMATETHGEAEVFLEARRQDGDDEVTMADVAVYVTQEAGAEAASDAGVALQIATAIVAEAQTKKEYTREESGGEEVTEAQDRENHAFLTFQAQLSASGSASAESEAIESLEEALIQAYLDAGIDIETQARARQAARAAIIKFSNNASTTVRLHLRKKAEILAALATSEAIEASFRSSGATEARLSALEQARNTLIAQLRGGASTIAMAEAKAEYKAEVHETLAAQIGVESSVLASADAALSTAKTALELALTTAASARAIAAAHASFYASAETAAQTSLAESGDAELGARVLTLLGASVE